MLSRIALFAVLCSFSLLAGCGKKSAAQLVEEERAKIREKKREEAAKFYKELAAKFPDDPKARDAAAKAQALQASATKK